MLNLATLTLHKNSFAGACTTLYSIALSPLRSVVTIHSIYSLLIVAGEIPSDLPITLRTVALHHNKFTSGHHQFTNLHMLETATLFHNQLSEGLSLPSSAPNLRNFLAHNNKLSCRVDYNHSVNAYNLTTHNAYTADFSFGALIAPGNRLAADGKPDWAIMSGISFVWLEAEWDRLFEPMLALAVVLALGLMAALFRCGSGRGCRHVFIFTPSGGFEKMQLLCAQILSVWSLFGGLVLAPLYVHGAGQYECGVAWLRTTIAYLYGNPAVEWAVAVVACVAAAASAFAVVQIYFRARTLYPMGLNSSYEAQLTWAQELLLWSLWIVLTAFFSLPSLMYAVASTMPGNEQSSIGLSSDLLAWCRFSSGPLLAIVVSIVVPLAARALVNIVVGQTCAMRTTRLITFSRFTVTLCVPILVLYIFGTDCEAKWLLFWTPCESTDSFQIDAHVPATIFSHAFKFELVSHDEICLPSVVQDGRCSRFIVEGMGSLIFSKLVVTAFVSPVVFLIFNLPRVVQMRQRFIQRWVNAEYQLTASLDYEVSSYIMIMDLAIVLGMAIPVLLPLMCFAVVSNLMVFHYATNHLQITTEHESLPACRYLICSVLFGSCLNMCFFLDNTMSDQIAHGTLLLVLAGVPIGVGAGAALGYYLYSDAEEYTGVSFYHLNSERDTDQDDMHEEGLVYHAMPAASNVDSRSGCNFSARGGSADGGVDDAEARNFIY